jgi:hypothetical protein
MKKISKENNELLLLGSDTDLDKIQNLNRFKKIITTRLDHESKLKEKGFDSIYFHRYAQSKENWVKIIDISKKWLTKWPNLPLNKEKKSILELFRFDDISLWWLVYGSIWETKNGIFDTIYNVFTISNLINQYNPVKITICGNYDFPVKDIFKIINNNEFEYEFQNYSEILNQANIEKSSTKLIFLTRFILLKIAKFFTKKKYASMAIFLKHGISSILVKKKSSQIILDNYVYGLDNYFLKNKNKFLFISLEMPKLGKNFIYNLIMDFIHTLSGEYVPWITYKKINDIRKFFKKIEYYSKKINQLEKETEFRESMKINDIDMYSILKKIFQKNLPRLLAFAEMEIALCNDFQKQEKLPVFSTDLMSPSGKALCFATKKQNLPAITPQGGIISPQFPLNVGFYITENFDQRVLPQFLVWGKHWEDIIIKRGYPNHLIEKVGFWSLKENEEISNNSNYVLFITGAHIDKITYVYPFDDEIFTIKKIRKLIPKHVELIVKIHPSLSLKNYKKALKEIELKIITKENESEYPNLIQNAMIVIGKTSTLLIKSLCIGKPIMNVNFSSDVDFIGTEEYFVTNSEMFKIKFLELKEKKYQKNLESSYYNLKSEKSIEVIENILENYMSKIN